MRVHTKKPHTKQVTNSSIEETFISAEEYRKKAFADLPSGAIALIGLRYREDLTQKQLGELIGVKQSNISLMERGKRPIGKTIAKRLAKVLKADYRRFL